MTSSIVTSIAQQRMDALAAKYLHRRELHRLQRCSRVVDVLALLIPSLLLTARYLAKGTWLSPFAETLAAILAALLFAGTLLKLALRWPEGIELHSSLLGENVSLAYQAEKLLQEPDSITKRDIDWFLDLASNLTQRDERALSGIRSDSRQSAFREALKEFSPGEIALCPKCGAFPWEYSPGSCQMCGSTPAERTSAKSAAVGERP